MQKQRAVKVLWRVMEKGPRSAALKTTERVLICPSDPHQKGKKWSEIPFICLQYFFCRILPGRQFPQGVILCCWSMCWRSARLQGRGSLGMGEASRCSKSGSTGLAGLKAFGFNKGKIQSFYTFPGESSLSLETRALPSRVISQQSRSLLCDKCSLLIIQEHAPLPRFHAALPSGPAVHSPNAAYHSKSSK